MGTVAEADAPPLTEDAVREAVSDPASRQILAACMDQARPVREISEATDISTATAYRRVDDLQEAGLLIVERSAISEDGSRYDLYRSRVEDVLLRVSAEGTSVRWSVEESVEDRIAQMWEQMRL